MKNDCEKCAKAVDDQSNFKAGFEGGSHQVKIRNTVRALKLLSSLLIRMVIDGHPPRAAAHFIET